MVSKYEQALKSAHRPIRVAVVGCGWFGGGSLAEMIYAPNIHPWLVINRHIDKAVKRLEDSCVPKSKIHILKSAKDLPYRPLQDHYYVAKSYSILKQARHNIDVVLEAVGDILVSTKIILESLDAQLNIITASAEVLSLIGIPLNRIAEMQGVLLTVVDGDQPGCITRLVDETKIMGFIPVVVGNVKGFLDYYQNPKGVLPWVPKGQYPRKICMYADGTKQAMELALVANMYGYTIAKRGCHGITTTKETLGKDFEKKIAKLPKNQIIVDYVLGIDGVDRGGGVFILARHPDKRVKADLRYLKKGDGPYYLMFRDHHLCYFETVRALVDLVIFEAVVGIPSVQKIDVIAVAKTDIKRGKKLDGMGGFDCYGLTEKTTTVLRKNYLPMQLVEFAKLKKGVKKDQVLTYDDVTLDDNVVVLLRRDFEKTISRK